MTDPVVLDHGRQRGRCSHDEARPTAATACWAANYDKSLQDAAVRSEDRERLPSTWRVELSLTTNDWRFRLIHDAAVDRKNGCLPHN
jgi:hypothetical protein